MRPLSEHLFGIVALGSAHVAPYCTCGLIFDAVNYNKAESIRSEWVRHVRKVMSGTEIRNPLA